MKRISLELVRTMRAETDDVLENHLVVRLVEAGLVLCELQTEAGEFGAREIHHHGCSFGLVFTQQLQVVTRDAAVADGSIVQGARVELVVTDTRAPTRHELVYGLRIPAVLVAGVWSLLCERFRCIVQVVTEGAVFRAPVVLGLKLEVLDRGITERRPLPDETGAPGFTLQVREDILDFRICRIQIIVFALLCFGLPVRCTD